MKPRFIRNEWVGGDECITVISQSKKMKNVVAIVMDDFGDFDFCTINEFDYKLKRDEGYVLFAAPLVKECHLSSAIISIILALNNVCKYNGKSFHAPVSAVESVIKKCCIGMFDYPQIDRFDLVKELYEQ